MPTTQEKLSRIYEVINFPYDDGDSVYTPVEIGHVLDWMEIHIPNYAGESSTHYSPRAEAKARIDIVWKLKRLPIDDQDYQVIDYVFNLLPQ